MIQRVWCIGVTYDDHAYPQGKLKPFLQRLSVAKEEGVTYFDDYAQCLEEAEGQQVQRDAEYKLDRQKERESFTPAQNKALELLDQYLAETPKEEVIAAMEKIDAMDFSGLTVKEYFDSFNGATKVSDFWVPVKIGLPNLIADEEVLCLVTFKKNDNTFIDVVSDYFTKEGWRLEAYGSFEVIAWMHFPTPYKP